MCGGEAQSGVWDGTEACLITGVQVEHGKVQKYLIRGVQSGEWEGIEALDQKDQKWRVRRYSGV